jgi:hypothetical protein
MAEHKTLAEAFVAAQQEMKHPRQTGSNPAYKSKFVPRDEAIDCVLPVCHAHGIAVVQSPVTVEGRPGVVTSLIHKLGERWDFGPFTVDPSKRDPQGETAGITYASRTALMQVFARAGDLDDDGNQASEKPKPDPNGISDNPLDALICTAELNGKTDALWGFLKEHRKGNDDRYKTYEKLSQEAKDELAGLVA